MKSVITMTIAMLMCAFAFAQDMGTATAAEAQVADQSQDEVVQYLNDHKEQVDAVHGNSCSFPGDSEFGPCSVSCGLFEDAICTGSIYGCYCKKRF